MDNLIYNVTIFADDAEWLGTICQSNVLTVSLIVTYLEKYRLQYAKADVLLVENERMEIFYGRNAEGTGA